MKTLFTKQDFNSTKWFTLEKLVQLIIAIIIVPKIFNTLGTTDIGKLKYVEAIVGMFSPIFFLGLAAVSIKEIINHPKKTTTIIATAFIMRLVSWVFVSICLLFYSFYINDSLFWLYVLVIFGYLFRLTDVAEYIFIVNKNSKFIFISKISSLIIVVGLQCLGVVNNLSVTYFALVLAVDFLFQSIIYTIIITKINFIKFNELKFSRSLAKHLIKLSFPLIISNLLITFYITIDEIFLKHFHDEASIGVFAVVQFLVIGVSWSIGYSIITTLYPSLAESYSTNKKEYQQKILQICLIMSALGLAIGLFFTLFGNHVLDFFYAEEFQSAKIPLQLFSWSPLFVFIGMVYEKHLLNTNQLHKNVYRFTLGCIVNVILCYLLIPKWELIGVALAVLTSHFITNIGYILVDTSSRHQFFKLIKNIKIS